MKLTSRELATVLAALRSLQQRYYPPYCCGDHTDESRVEYIRDSFFEHFTEHAPLHPSEIDSLCERINVSEENNPDEMVLACPNCKSTNVQSQYWVRENTKEVLDPTECYSWCSNCEETDGDGEIRFVDLLWIKRSETFEKTNVV